MKRNEKNKISADMTLENCQELFSTIEREIIYVEIWKEKDYNNACSFHKKLNLVLKCSIFILR